MDDCEVCGGRHAHMQCLGAANEPAEECHILGVAACSCTTRRPSYRRALDSTCKPLSLRRSHLERSLQLLRGIPGKDRDQLAQQTTLENTGSRKLQRSLETAYSIAAISLCRAHQHLLQSVPSSCTESAEPMAESWTTIESDPVSPACMLCIKECIAARYEDRENLRSVEAAV
jgi:hypothetical protein